MSRIYDKPISLQVINENTELWEDALDKPLHARINTTQRDREISQDGAIRAKRALTFEVRYFGLLAEIALNTQLYRIVYKGVPYNITGIDDFMERHVIVKIFGEAY